jgi:integrase
MSKRGNGMLYRRGRIWWIQFYEHGKRLRMSSESTDEAVARRLLRDKLARITLGEPLVIRSARVTYDELRDDLVEHYKTTGARDLVEAGTRLKHLNHTFRGIRAEQLTGTRITAYIAQRQATTAANGTINREVGVLLKMLRLGVERGKVVRVPIVHKPKEAAPRAGFVERGAFEAIRAGLPHDLRVAATIAYTYGWRMQSEVLALEVRQVDLRNDELRLDAGQTKNDDGRVVKLTEELRGLLEAQLGRVKILGEQLGRVIAALFPYLRVKGSHIAPALVGTPRRDFRKAWRSACKAAGYAGLLRHDLRRSAVRNMVNGGTPERVAMKVTGHRTRSIFDRYHIVSMTDLEDMARRADSATIAATPAPVTPLAVKRKAKTARG